MAKITVQHKQDYTVLKNNMFRDKNLSLKARGLLATMLSLPKDWDYTTQGLTKILKDGEASIRSALKELERAHYLKRVRVKDELGKFSGIEYVLYEIPHVDNPYEENPHVENPHVDNRGQLNKYISNKKELNTNELNTYLSRGKRFSPPTLEEVRQYCLERKNNVDAEKFVNFYSSKGWMVGKNRMKDWKAAVRTWERNNQDEHPTQNLDNELDKDLNLDDIF